MANTKSAEKQHRHALKNHARNSHVRSTLRTQVHKFRDALEGGDAPKTAEALKLAIRTIAKAASKGVIHKTQASRRIARLSKAAQAKK